MFSHLKKLKCIITLSRSAVRAISIYKLLKKIKNLNKILKDNKFSFKERAVKLLKKWKVS
jgi:hypothetical protein